MEAVDLWEELTGWLGKDRGQRYMRGLMNARRADGFTTLDGDSINAAWLAVLRAGAIVYVTRDMVTMAEAAAKSMPTQALRAEDLPFPGGLCILQTPVHMKDIKGKAVSLKAFIWSPARTESGERGVHMGIFSDRFDPEDDYMREARGRSGEDIFHGAPRLLALSEHGWRFGESNRAPMSADAWGERAAKRIAAALGDANGVMEHANRLVETARSKIGDGIARAKAGLEELEAARLHLNASDEGIAVASGILEEMKVAIDMGDEPIAETLAAMDFWQRTFPAALWALMQQPIVETVTERPQNKGVLRRIAKASLPVPGVRVIKLRRIIHRTAAPVDPGAAEVEWSHRWLVNGFWRNQFHPRPGGCEPCACCGRADGFHRQRWIAPFIKGPGDKPFVAKREVHVLAR